MPRGIYPRRKPMKIHSHPKGIITFLFHQISKKELADILALGVLILSEKD